jgi:tetratricopeptide (TPR) repeat protein
VKRGGRLLAAALLLAASSCSNGPAGSPQGAYARGLEALAEGKPRTARIEFLNAIKADPRNSAIRLAQALTYLRLGDGIAAEAEVARARALGAAAADTRHLMAHAYLLQGQADRAAEEASGASPAYAAYAERIRGRALMELGDMAGARDAFDSAIEAGPADSEVWADVARFRRAGGELAEAIEAADKAVGLDPNNAEALTLRGELTRSQYGLAAAIPWFDRALEIDPERVETLAERAATLGDLGRMRAMLADTRKILSLQPGHPIAHYLQAMLAARAGNFPLARSLYQRTNGALDAQPAAMLLASAIDLETGNAERAIQRLHALVGAQPDNAKARRLLASAQWRRGDAAATVETLRRVADRPDADSYSLTLIGRALARQGEVEAAARYLARAAEPRGRAATALFERRVDGVELAALRRSADDRPGDAGLQVQLIRALLGTGQAPEALARARRLQAASPGAPEAHVLVGDALGIGGDFAGAAEQYRKAANIAFTEPVAMRLIEALRNSGDNRRAGEVLQLFLQQNPQSVPAGLLAAGLYMQAGDWDSAIGLYESLRRRLGNRDATLLNNLAWAWSEKGEYERALPFARRAWELDPKSPATADTYGWVLFKSGRDRVQGLALMEQALRGAPTDEQIARHLEAARGG